MRHRLFIGVTLLIFISGLIYMDTAAGEGNDSLDDFVAVTVFLCGFFLYHFSEWFRFVVNLILGVILVGAITKRLDKDGKT